MPVSDEGGRLQGLAVRFEPGVLSRGDAFRVGEEGERRLRLRTELAQLLWGVDADGHHPRVECVEIMLGLPQLGQLRMAERSPVAPVEHEHDRLAAQMVAQAERLSILVGELEGRRSLAYLRLRGRTGRRGVQCPPQCHCTGQGPDPSE
jgi:hypothetical protein